MRSFYRIIMLLFLLVSLKPAFAQKEKLAKTSAGFPVNYEEELVGNYTLPDLLALPNGQRVTNAKIWEQKRRPGLIKLFEEIQYGKAPSRPKSLSFKIIEKGTPAFGGKAIRRQVVVYFTKDTGAYKMDLLIYLPANAQKPSPLLLNISFTPNCTTVNDSCLKAASMWTKEGKKVPANRGKSAFDIEKFISQGFGVATVYYGDIEPDFKKGIQFGIRGHYLKPGTSQPAPNEWGAIAAWSWGLSRTMDYLETDKQVDARRIALQGTSRLGKTVLWTGVRDSRFKMVIASCSGEGGAAISRRNYGECIKHITDTSRYFYQFAANYHGYSQKVDSLPVDAHMLVALMAPRPVLLQTGDTDYWSDPKGEFLAAVAAEPVFKFYNKKGPGTDVMPQAGDTSLLNTLGYYMHSGGHGTIPSDWDIYIDFMKKFL